MTLPLDSVFAGRLEDGVLGAADSEFVVLAWTDPAGGPVDDPARLMPPLHVHLEDDEAWYVLEGTFRFRVGEHEIEAPRLGGLGTARRSAHVLESRPWPGALPARDDAEDARLIETLHDLPDRTPDTLEDHFRKYGCEIVE